MTANKGPDSDLIFLLGITFADGPALPLIASLREEGSRLPSSTDLCRTRLPEQTPKHQL